jgi:hypothetical protein
MIAEQPEIYIFNIRINEPVTMITDLMVSGVCYYAFIRLSADKNPPRTLVYLKYYLLVMGIATTLGGIIGHGFLYLFSFAWKLPGWLVSMVSINLIERAAIEHARNIIHPRLGKFFSWLNIIELLTFVTITFSTVNFFFVEVHSAYGLLVVVSSFNLYVFMKTRDPASGRFLIAVGIAAISALIYMNEWGISKWFNYTDISHCLITAAAWFFYRGGKLLPSGKLSYSAIKD